MNIETIKSVYFVGAGGIGMSALVRYFLFKGKLDSCFSHCGRQHYFHLERIESGFYESYRYGD